MGRHARPGQDIKEAQVGVDLANDGKGPVPFFYHSADGSANGPIAVAKNLQHLLTYVQPKKLLMITDRGCFSAEQAVDLVRKHHFDFISSLTWTEALAKLYDQKKPVMKEASFWSLKEQRKRQAEKPPETWERYFIGEIPSTITHERPMETTSGDQKTEKRSIRARLIYVFSTADQKVCRKIRMKYTERLGSGLAQIQSSVQNGYLKDTQAVHKRINALYGNKSARNYFSYQVEAWTAQDLDRLPPRRPGQRKPTLTFSYPYHPDLADVRYVITEEEKKVFLSLSTPEEREQFIEQFWYRRDEDLSTAINEFKEEHYRRIAYANERFASGMPGWMTDRGRIYIIHGKPDEIQAHPAGGPYTRPMHEGGGTTATFPFEVWRYRHLEGIGSDIELEFVDPTFSGEYRLALRPEEKDALLHVPGGGPTLAEELGIANKEDRPFFWPGTRDYPFQFTRAKDQPFQRYETYVMVQRPKEIKYKDLREIVNVNVSYNNLPFKIREDYIRLNEEQVLVPITLEFNNKDLTFKEEIGIHSAKIAIYGVITSITNRIIYDDDCPLCRMMKGAKSLLASSPGSG